MGTGDRGQRTEEKWGEKREYVGTEEKRRGESMRGHEGQERESGNKARGEVG